MKRLLVYNASVIAGFCGVWYCGFYLSERWMRVIDLGLPWSWLGALFAASYIGSLWLLRENPKAALKALVGPLISEPVFWVWVALCATKFDPCP
jgi:hypothetical protein